MYKYNKYKKKYLNLLYGGSSGVDDTDTYNINILTLSGEILCTLTLDKLENIDIKRIKKKLNKM